MDHSEFKGSPLGHDDIVYLIYKHIYFDTVILDGNIEFIDELINELQLRGIIDIDEHGNMYACDI